MIYEDIMNIMDTMDTMDIMDIMDIMDNDTISDYGYYGGFTAREGKMVDHFQDP